MECQITGERMRQWVGLEFMKPQILPPVTHFLQQGDTYSHNGIDVNPFK